ncbi:hypothetical protein PNOK_0424000 [Pyrrhoderma noxium]|uniref:DUF6533 domain-containing protein n=1 Tax=Pyrrhoderma noxium TaxID=2282107 RepID=A0A286UI55_9AGAM|nr:hypothetical protein PNOK_0424000 [Pyrrhoderma noxium]
MSGHVNLAEVTSILGLRREEYFSRLALAVVTIYSTLTTIDKEIEYFWINPRKPISIIFLSTRYLGILVSLLMSWPLISNEESS